jgi:hypothetical protein
MNSQSQSLCQLLKNNKTDKKDENNKSNLDEIVQNL